MGDDMLDYKAIGRKISYYRKAKQYTQAALAETLDISESYMSQVECGKVEISLKRLDQIAEVLDLDIVMLLSDTNLNAKSYGAAEISEWIQDWAPEQKELLLTLIRCADEQISAKKK